MNLRSSEPRPPSVPPSAQMLAIMALVISAIGTILGVVWSAVVKGNEAAQTLLGTLATASLSALVVLAGGRHGGGSE